MCKLLYDYTRICQHNTSVEKTQEYLQKWSEQQTVYMAQLADQSRSMEQRMENLKGIMDTLDALSTIKTTAFTVVQGSFSDVIVLFLREDFNSLMGDDNRRSCSKCASMDLREEGDKNSESVEKLKIVEHALLILNRCLTYHLNGLLEDSPINKCLIEVVKLKGGENKLNISESIESCIQDEFKTMIERTVRDIEKINIAKKLKQKSFELEKEISNKLRFTTLSLLTQAYVNILILSPNREKLMDIIFKQK